MMQKPVLKIVETPEDVSDPRLLLGPPRGPSRPDQTRNDIGYSWFLDKDGGQVQLANTTASLLGYPTGKPLFLPDVIHPADAPRIAAALVAGQQGRATFDEILRLRHRSGKYLWVHALAAPDGDAGRDSDELHGILRCIDELGNGLAPLAQALDRYRVVTGAMSEAVFEVDREGRLESLNKAAATMLDRAEHDLIGQSINALGSVKHRRNGGATEHPIHRTLTTGRAGHGRETVWIDCAGNKRIIDYRCLPLYGATDQVSGGVWLVSDRTASHNAIRELSYRADHDALTGLLSRRAFETQLERRLQQMQLARSQQILCYLDIDHFQAISRACGSLAGDELLRQTAGLLQEALPADAIIATLTGDEFAILFDTPDITPVWNRMKALIARVADYRFRWQARQFRIGMSIGLLAIDDRCRTVQQTMSVAELACARAKLAGGNHIHIARTWEQQIKHKRNEYELYTRINEALDKDHFHLWVQPIYSATEPGRICLAEILLRLESEEGWVQPGDFLPCAERMGLSGHLDCWVVSHFLQRAADMPRHLRESITWCINLSAASIGAPEVQTRIAGLLDATAIDPSRLCFEITESAAIQDFDPALEFITRLKGRGCRFALDDFGCGFSSFAYLQRFPVEYLKIDGQFIQDIHRNKTNRALVQAINTVGQVMDKRTIAEYVEDRASLQVIQALGVDFVQGFYLARPMSLTKFLQRN